MSMLHASSELAGGGSGRTSSGVEARSLFPLVYGELRAMAASFLRHERRDHTLQPTALAHEVYLRLAGRRQPWTGPEEFLSAAAAAVRRVLIDHAKRRNAAKRRAPGRRMALWAAPAVGPSDEELLCLDEALGRLEGVDPRRARVAELRLFAGMTDPEIASVLQVARSTVSADWAAARAWLSLQLGGRSA